MNRLPAPLTRWIVVTVLASITLSACNPAAPVTPATMTPLPPSPSPTRTATRIPPTATVTSTPIPPTHTFTPSPTATRTLPPPTATFTPSPTATFTQVPPTRIPPTPVPPTETPAPAATTGTLVVILCQDITVGVLLILTKPDSGEPSVQVGLAGAGGAATIIELTPGHWLGTYYASGYDNLTLAYDIVAGETFTQRIGTCN